MEHENIGSCKSGDCGGTCMLCCLDVCKHCGLYEGSLTTHCAGKRVSMKVAMHIYESGKLDYRNGAWVDEPNPHNQQAEKWRKTSQTSAEQ